MIRPRPASPLLRPLLAAALAAILVAGLAPAPSPVAAADDGLTAADIEGSDGEPSQRPSPAYEAWVEHEDDAIEFEPGGRVTVGFSPRAGDTWPIGGKAPTKLPPGRATGGQMAAMPNGTAWAKVPGKPLPAGARDVPSGGGDPSDGGPRVPAKPTLPGPVDAPSNDRTIAATGVVAEQPVADPGFDLAAASGLRRQVYGFLPYWELNGAASRLDYDVLSTIAYFSVGVTAKGNLRKRDPDGTLTTGWGGWTSASMTKVINQAHRNRTRVVLTVSAFAWTSSQAAVQRALLGSPSARLNLVRQVVAAVRDRGADGVNLDFEPLVRGYGDEFVKLLRLFRTEFNKVRSGYSIVYDTTAYIGNYPLEASVRRGAADAIFVMGYDYRIHNASRSGSIAPLSGPGYDLADTVRAYTARVPASRIILGIPWYGRAWSTASDAPRSRTLTGLKHGYSRAVNYESVVEYVRRYGRRWDPVEQSPYVAFRRRNCTDAYGCVTSWRQIWYEDAASLKRRYALVNDYGLRGTGMWALGYEGGHEELYKALAASFLGDRIAPAAGIRVLSPDQGDEGFVVRWAGRDASPIVAYDVQVAVNGGRWKTWLGGTKATSEVYPGRHGARYAFRVRARDSRGNVGAWNVVSTGGEPRIRVGGFGRVVRDGLSYRAGPDVSAARLGRMAKGTIVAITRGPVVRDGFTWYEVTQPIRQWSPASRAERGVWVAFRSASGTFVRAAHAPNATRVRAGLRGFTFGA
ncbi:MAG TPA: glycosyl hydrolase family 18 protein, partial [Candidatus Limnocylindrales bacterium]|nr:glycosyl hydrolase family 18 protein [Candidatus Limnocylindrales bacterium]